MKTKSAVAVVATLASLLLLGVAGAADDPEDQAADDRGRMLYENHCIGCHDSVVHIRNDRRAQSMGEVEARVRHWSGYQRLEWTDEEVDDVTAYLMRRFYGVRNTPTADRTSG